MKDGFELLTMPANEARDMVLFSRDLSTKARIEYDLNIFYILVLSTLIGQWIRMLGEICGIWSLK